MPAGPKETLARLPISTPPQLLLPYQQRCSSFFIRRETRSPPQQQLSPRRVAAASCRQRALQPLRRRLRVSPLLGALVQVRLLRWMCGLRPGVSGAIGACRGLRRLLLRSRLLWALVARGRLGLGTRCRLVRLLALGAAGTGSRREYKMKPIAACASGNGASRSGLCVRPRRLPVAGRSCCNTSGLGAAGAC